MFITILANMKVDFNIKLQDKKKLFNYAEWKWFAYNLTSLNGGSVVDISFTPTIIFFTPNITRQACGLISSFLEISGSNSPVPEATTRIAQSA